MNAECPTCGWTMEADDEQEAQDLLSVHVIVALLAGDQEHGDETPTDPMP